MTDVLKLIEKLVAEYPPYKPDPLNWVENNYPMRWVPPERMMVLTTNLSPIQIIPGMTNLT